jgi:hypothetical protein
MLDVAFDRTVFGFFARWFFWGSPSPYTLDRADEISTLPVISAGERSEVHKHTLANFPDFVFALLKP